MELAGQPPLFFSRYLLRWYQVDRGGKSGLHRAECQVTPGGREPTESATESIPPMVIF
jgi:hypothetical protein